MAAGERHEQRGSIMTLTAPHASLYRREALVEYQRWLSGVAPTPETLPAKQLVNNFSIKDYRSLLMPVNGLYVDIHTPTTFTLATCRLPYRRLVLEWSRPPATAAEPAPAGTVHATAGILLVQWHPEGKELRAWKLENRSPLPQLRWYFSPLVMQLTKNSELRIDSKGQLHAHDLGNAFAFRANYAPADVSAMVRNYTHDLIVLAHLSMLCSNSNVHLEKIPMADAAPAPDECYVLKCTGPTEFNWLPGSGISAT
jgi:hypothetical protein